MSRLSRAGALLGGCLVLQLAACALLDAATQYVVHDDYVVDTDNDLVWERHVSSGQLDAAGALAYCGALELGGFTDWEVPDELIGINDGSQTPCVDPELFPDTPCGGFWVYGLDQSAGPDTAPAQTYDFCSDPGCTVYDQQDAPPGTLAYVRCVLHQALEH